jgi:uncharacterized protein
MSHVCGDCTLCCTLLHVTELNKPSHVRCVHLIQGVATRPGCSIYHKRPQSCKDFECMWLQEDDMPQELRPDRSHVVLWVTSNGKILIASVDPAFPNAYREGEMGRLLQSMLNVPDAQVGIIVGEARFPLEPDLNRMSFADEEATTFQKYYDETEINSKPMYTGEPEFLQQKLHDNDTRELFRILKESGHGN